jgi:hypothetical protein
MQSGSAEMYTATYHLSRIPFVVSVVLPLYTDNLREEMQKYISLDQLPAMHGGDRYEPDAQCSRYIRPGRDVPPKYYLINCTETRREDMERVVVERGLPHKVRLEVSEPGSILKWEYVTIERDITFGVTMKHKVAERTEKRIIVRQAKFIVVRRS